MSMKNLEVFWVWVTVRECNINVTDFNNDPVTEEPFQKTNIPRKLSMTSVTMA